MAHTKILLREDVDDLGARGEIVRVKAGYARNYLLPRKLAVEATNSNVKQIEQERAALLKKEATERSHAEGQAEQIRALRAGVQTQIRRARRALWLGNFDGHCGSVERARLRNRPSSPPSARTDQATGRRRGAAASCIAKLQLSCR